MVASKPIGRGLFKKEELLINTIHEQGCDIFGVSEVDIENFYEENPSLFKVTNLSSHFTDLEKRRKDCYALSKIILKWYKEVTWCQICYQMYGLKLRQQDKTNVSFIENSMIWQVNVKWPERSSFKGGKIFHSQVDTASKEGLILGIGDMNIDIEKLKESAYYLKKLAEEH